MSRARANASRGLDLRKLAEGLKGADIDIRHWVSVGIVGYTEDDGTQNVTDDNCIVVAPDGVWCDVVLWPSKVPVTARVQFGVGGAAHIQAPIHAGDEVAVLIPDGDMMATPVIVAILNSQYDKLPLDAGLAPVFKNDRLLIQCGEGLPVEVHAAKIQFGDEEAAENFVLGQKYKTEANKIMDAIINDFRPSPVGPIGPSPAMIQAAQQFKANVDAQLSDFIFGQKAPPTHGV